MKKVIKTVYMVTSHNGDVFQDKLVEKITEIQNKGHEVETHLFTTSDRLAALLYGYIME